MGILTIAVTGLNATDNPGPGVPVIRSIRQGAGMRCRIIGFSYDPLDPGNYMHDIAESVYLMPYPSQGSEALIERIDYLYQRQPIDVLMPTLDAEIPIYLKIMPRLNELGIKTLLPAEGQLELRSKINFYELKTKHQIRVPKSIAVNNVSALERLHEEFEFPVVVKGQFYDAYIANSPSEVDRHFCSIGAKWGLPVVIQEYIAGEEYDVVAVGDGAGGVVGAVPMRKIQLTDKGKAWGGITVADPQLDLFVAETMDKLSWRGPCELEVIKAREDGNYYLIEINPRFPAWVYLTVGAQRNLPWAAVRLALGDRVEPMPPPQAGIMFLRHSIDQICALGDYASLSTYGELTRR